VLDAFQDHRPSGTVDAADCPPVSVPHPNPIFAAAQRASRWVCRERIGSKGLDPGEQRLPVTRR